MTVRFFWRAGLAASLALIGGGCGGGKSCEELCELNRSCAEFPDETPCEDQCKQREIFLKESACVPQQEEYDACVSKLEDVCDAAAKCTTEALALGDCLDDFCKANPNAPSCPGA